MKTNDVFPGRYLRPEDLDGDTPVTIKLVSKETMKQQDGTEDDKPVAYFKEFVKGLVLNKTNWLAISALYGDESDGWTGKKVALTAVRIPAYGEVRDVIRVVKPPAGAKRPTPDQVDAALGDAEVPA